MATPAVKAFLLEKRFLSLLTCDHNKSLNFNSVFLFTDGIVDQIGIENKKGYGLKQLKELIKTIDINDEDSAKKVVLTSFENWKGTKHQTDDITLIGIKFG